MKEKWLIGIVVFLLITNIGTLSYFMNESEETASGGKKSMLSTLSGSVAQIGNESISEKEWVQQLKERYGKEMLTQMINKLVVSQLAKKHNLSVSSDELKREIELYHRMVGTGADAQEHPDIQKMNDDQLKQEIKHAILLEELITKDVVINEEELRKYYNDHQQLYDLKPLFQISQIVVETKEEADQVIEELENGSSFSTLAREKSIDEFSAPSGGVMGWVDTSSNYVDPAYFEEIENMKKDSWSGPLKTKDGYGIVYLHDTKKGSSYKFEEVKGQIRRQLAIQQLESDFDPKQLWKELDVNWEYGTD
ncbi:peptidyl-prolyl cis-trans isomerase [Pseudalkalibacillus berkeleyi]|uniref:peptidylprolyl isomerase n=1 Tax=Pseudalkalibacillus berkeleyi TaxID=1069813 RepID=A0ABS9H6V9_9BACL|nr:peptidyl-prolyl cis-trans isomerase [Pseudalkalibacillus berkeleyi]MCF6139612.1 peptidyl-prolyl cis-trans isomerase [Pseudalkalibacillus berkeleyi]